MKNSCVIFGGSGFIGTHLTEYILEFNLHERVYILDLVRPRIDDPRVVYQYCDVRQSIELMVENCSVVYNLAALSKEPGYAYSEYFDTNYTGAVHVCAFAKRLGIAKLIFTSTMMVFRPSDEKMTEDSPTYPDTAYGISKLLAEKVHEQWQCAGAGRVLKIVRPAVVFGKYEGGNYTRLYRTLKRNFFFYIGRKTTVKSSIYVRDLVRFLVWCAKEPTSKSLYNFAYPEPLTIQRIVEALCTVMDLRQPFLVIPFKLALCLGYGLELLSNLGLVKSGIHHRRIEKLYYSTHIVPLHCLQTDFTFAYTLESALADWRHQCGGRELY
ncbi:NAD-dependent epimerase/dehydratase family protein [Anthocerotibacter panamensis]|uniref:NAD-dependent epimerase/dehydratase family protein n=1 Tax=Anthocerotibacter panamensis TaxID=2857077 RepID=UPI001C402960|nr:NAD(P)-dependent oxidoreductase [Anthocerotibacter panamensis]